MTSNTGSAFAGRFTLQSGTQSTSKGGSTASSTRACSSPVRHSRRQAQIFCPVIALCCHRLQRGPRNRQSARALLQDATGRRLLPGWGNQGRTTISPAGNGSQTTRSVSLSSRVLRTCLAAIGKSSLHVGSSLAGLRMPGDSSLPPAWTAGVEWKLSETPGPIPLYLRGGQNFSD